MAGEEAVTSLINGGASEKIIEVQKEHNQLLEKTNYQKDERIYYIDENGVLIKYIRTVILEKPNQENEMEEESSNIMIWVHSYQ